ncbi:hypothetical protein GCM10022267_89720 [Lentzea roselyniae]|uniref:PKS/mFAS DH domain-containing protein n=1 Tax=Lentzea roselyniae TaxID=531940 RepID=A0ABP7CJN1_9PSEU
MTTLFDPVLLGASGGLELISFLAGYDHEVTLTRRSGRHTTTMRVRPSVDRVPPQEIHQRHELVAVPRTLTGVTAEAPFLTEDTLVLTNDPTLIQESRPAHVKHVRVVVNLNDADLSTVDSEVLRLNTRVYKAAKENSANLVGGTFLISVLGGVSEGHVPHPSTGLFTGLGLALAHELTGCTVRVAVDSSRDLSTATKHVVAETTAPRGYPVAYRVNGIRFVITPKPVRLDASPTTTRHEVVVAAGGGRGIGAEMLKHLARTGASHIYVLGSNRIDDVDETMLTEDEQRFAARRPQFIRERTTGPGAVSVPEAVAALRRIADARKVAANLAELRTHCGPDGVTYIACDTRDSAAVRVAVDRVFAAHNSVDLLLNIVGTTKSATIATKSVEEFEFVRDLKVRTYTALKQAFAGRTPKTWLNCGSISGSFGMSGETDYSAANAFLNTASAYAASRGCREFTMGWGLWGEAGMGAERELKAVLEKNGVLTPIGSAEGVAHLGRELAVMSPRTSLFFSGSETSMLSHFAPGWLTDDAREPTGVPIGVVAPTGRPSDSTVAPAAFRFDTVETTPGKVVLRGVLDPERDRYLDEHLVHGVPTLPGMFVPELAIAAAAHLVPGRVAFAFEDMEFRQFLRVRRSGQPFSVTGELVAENEHESVMCVTVAADVLAPNDQVLVADKERFRTLVRLRTTQPQPPAWLQTWREICPVPVGDPYYTENPVVRLTGIFNCTSDSRVHQLGASAEYRLDPAKACWLDGWHTPAVLLDAMARLAALRVDDNGRTPLLVPNKLASIELYGAAGTPIALHATPLHSAAGAPGWHQVVAVDANARVVARVRGLSGTVLGHVHATTGEFSSYSDSE